MNCIGWWWEVKQLVVITKYIELDADIQHYM